MRIMFLNVWNGKIRNDIAKFIKEQSDSTDVFCFQEVYEEMKILCSEILPNYKEITAYKLIAEDETFSQATYVKKNVKIVSSGIIFENKMRLGLGIYAQLRLGGKDIHICNFHSFYKPGDKLDTPDSIGQSQALVKFFRRKKGLKIIGGDFNLLPETKSIRIFEESGYRNLIGDFKISTTRNRLAWDMYPNNKLYYSDYIFVDPDVKCKSFSVPNIEVADHLPLMLDIEL